MLIRKPRRDRRYTIAREYCGYPQQRHVARFCGDWLGQAKTPSAAQAIAAGHAANRNTIIEGSTR